MVQPINVSQLQQYREQIKEGGVDAAVKVYDELYDKGHGYAGWAKNVAKGWRGFSFPWLMSFTGIGAIHFLDESFYDDHCRYLTGEEIDKIKKEMALNTLDKYIEIANQNNGTFSPSRDEL